MEVKKQTHDEYLPSGSVIHWGQRDPTNRNRVVVTCCKCKQARMTTIQRKPSWTGACRGCRKYGRKAQDERLPSGSIIHWGQRDPNNYMRVMVTCGACHRKQMKLVQFRPRWTGKCKHCVFRRQDEQQLLSGSIIHWGERDPNDARLVMVTCGRCKQKRLTTPGRGKMLQKWSGFCLKCTAAPRRYSSDETLPSGSIIHWGARNEGEDGRVPVTCFICKQTRMTTLPPGHRRQAWTGFCRSHTVAELAQQLRQAPASTGRPRNDRAQLYQEVIDAIRKVWSEVRLLELPFDDRLDLVTQIKVAAVLGLGEKGTEKSAD
jgi:hypothetical protein